ncbi:MAG: inorganic diphosphatase [Proteobacteria bacterium]|nr:inorganic diphosphatase [Pseudomonadota bacterium]
MDIKAISVGQNPPEDINVIIEVPIGGPPIKYEMDKASGGLFVDRIVHTAMHYPCNYGYIPETLADDGDPVDVLVVTDVPLISGSVVQCRPVGMLAMTDESGVDAKILAVPVDKLSSMYSNINAPNDFPDVLVNQITHFFEHYKDLELGKWVKVEGWRDAAAAREEIMASYKRNLSTEK